MVQVLWKQPRAASSQVLVDQVVAELSVQATDIDKLNLIKAVLEGPGAAGAQDSTGTGHAGIAATRALDDQRVGGPGGAGPSTADAIRARGVGARRGGGTTPRGAGITQKALRGVIGGKKRKGGKHAKAAAAAAAAEAAAEAARADGALWFLVAHARSLVAHIAFAQNKR